MHQNSFESPQQDFDSSSLFRIRIEKANITKNVTKKFQNPIVSGKTVMVFWDARGALWCDYPKERLVYNKQLFRRVYETKLSLQQRERYEADPRVKPQFSCMTTMHVFTLLN